MIINNPYTPGIQVAITGEILRWKLIPIGPWNMVGTAFKDIPHGLTKENIVIVNIMVRNDTDTAYFPFDTVDAATVNPTRMYVETAVLSLYTGPGSFFDTALFDDPVLDRGFVYIVYKD